MALHFDFDFKQPDYGKVFRHRLELFNELQTDAGLVAALKVFYKANPAQFIIDWGTTFDPRNADIGLPTTIPFLLYDKQEEWISWVMNCWRNREPGITEKSRELGVSWLSVALACTICLFNDGVVIGFGSRKELYVDKIGEPKSLFWKARKFLEFLPPQFLGGFNLRRDAPHMRITLPDTGSTITGEAGDGIGRGDRTSLYFIDESAYIERPQLIEASLASTTNCRIDISSAHGMGNPFAQRRFSGKIKVFTFSWRDDPRKDQAWYDKQVNDLDPVTLAQEIDINYAASIEGVVIPGAWIQTAVDACRKIGIEPTGGRFGALDVADEGRDLNAFAGRQGVELFYLSSWSGKDSDTFYTSEKAFMCCDNNDIGEFQYDADGMGAFVRGDSRVINDRRASNRERHITVNPYRGSGEVISPEKEWIKGRKNKDYFQNRKAQSWFSLRFKFQNTFRAVKGEDFDPEEIISIRSDLPELQKLLMELTQPTYTLTTSGKIIIDKAPDNTRSPNLADAVNMVYAPAKRLNSIFANLAGK